MNLISPPRWTTDIGDAYMIKAGVIQPGYSNSLGSCLNKPTPLNVTRAPFPISGGSLVFGFVNDTASPSPDPTDEKFWIDMYFTDDNADYSSNSFFKWGLIRRMEYWQGFETGWSCTMGFNMTSRLRQPGNESALRLLEGMDVTIALLVSVGRGPFRGDPNWAGGTWEEVDQVCFSLSSFPSSFFYSFCFLFPFLLWRERTNGMGQCAYVTLTSNTRSAKRELRPRDENQDMCNRVNLDYFGTPTPTTSALPTATSSAATEKMISSRASANSLVGVTFILAVLSSGFGQQL
jgi:hypothetical protein